MDSKEEAYLNKLYDEVDTPSSGPEFDDSDADPTFINESDSESLSGTSMISENEEPTVVNVPAAAVHNWTIPNIRSIQNLSYNVNQLEVGVNPDILETMIDATPYDFFSLFVDDEIINLIVTETNRYAEQQQQKPNIKQKSRIKNWTPTDPDEIRNFLGIILWMGLVQMPSLSSYWKKEGIFQCNIPNYMARNRFELLLATFHFANNLTATQGDRLYKVQPLIDMLVWKFNNAVIPEEFLCIDESMIPFMGRLSFRQYIQNKRHRYGIKVFKLCTKGFYTLQFKVYAGKEAVQGAAVSTKVVTELMEPYIHFGRTLYTDNWYTSIPLAVILLENETHLVGTIRQNRKGIPVEVVKKQLKRGEKIALQNDQGIMVLKWKDRRDVLMLSTKNLDAMTAVRTRSGEKFKPDVVEEYNTGKSFIDISDQLSSYHSIHRRSLKWYRKIAFDILLNTAVVNALSVYSTTTGNKMSITKFRESITNSLLTKKKRDNNLSSHSLKKNVKRGRCYYCYCQIVKEEGRKVAQKKTPRVWTKCESCEKFLCNGCFFSKHASKLP